MENTYVHIQLLLDQRRYDQADAKIKELLQQPEVDFQVYELLAFVKIKLQQFEAAEDVVKIGLSLAPNHPYFYYYSGIIKAHKKQYESAKKELREAISLYPNESEFYITLSRIYYETDDYTNAEKTVRQALSLAPKNLNALNLLASILNSMGRKGEAIEVMDNALEMDPENVESHTNYGWAYLHKGDNEKALMHFQSALRRDPTLISAQNGLMEAMKARFFVYRWFLRFMLWLSDLGKKGSWAVLFGGYLLVRLLSNLSKHIEGLSYFLNPIIVVIALFFLSTWILHPLMDLYLLTNQYGKILLDDERKQKAKMLGMLLLISAVSACIGLLTGYQPFYMLSVFAIAFMIPMANYSEELNELSGNKLKWLKNAIYGFGSIALLYAFLTGEVFSWFSVISFILFIAYQWYANYIMIEKS